MKGDKARLLPVAERAGSSSARRPKPARPGQKKAKSSKSLSSKNTTRPDADAGWGELKGPPPGTTVLDRLHQAMILFAARRGELLKRSSMTTASARTPASGNWRNPCPPCTPAGSDEKRWVDGVLARKKGLGL